MHIKLNAAGISTSFVQGAQKFYFMMEFDNGTATAADARSQVLAAVDRNRAAAANQQAKEAADEGAGILPF